MSDLESYIQRRALWLAEHELGVLGTKLETPGATGFPDIIFWLPRGKPMLVEFKRPGEAPRPKQVYVHGFLRNLDYDVRVFDDPDLCAWAIREELKKRGVTCIS